MPLEVGTIRLIAIFFTMGMNKVRMNPCCIKRDMIALILLICLYIDDIIYTNSSQVFVDEFKVGTMNTFEMSDLRMLHSFLGFGVKQGVDEIFIFLKKYAEWLLKCYNMYQCKKTNSHEY